MIFGRMFVYALFSVGVSGRVGMGASRMPGNPEKKSLASTTAFLAVPLALHPPQFLDIESLTPAQRRDILN